MIKRKKRRKSSLKDVNNFVRESQFKLRKPPKIRGLRSFIIAKNSVWDLFGPYFSNSVRTIKKLTFMMQPPPILSRARCERMLTVKRGFGGKAVVCQGDNHINISTNMTEIKHFSVSMKNIYHLLIRRG